MKTIQLLTIITALSAASGALAQVPSKINDQQQHPSGVVSEMPHGMAVFTNSGTWTRPEGVHRVHVKLWGGGGGGGWSATWITPTGCGVCCGGGGGGYCEGVITVTRDVSVTVGSGGAAGPAPTGGGVANPTDYTGGSGGNSSFLSLTANGGGGGDYLLGILCPDGNGGSASGGSLNVAGQNGGQYNGGNAAFGGGLGSANPDGSGGFPGGGGGSLTVTTTITLPGGSTTTEPIIGPPGPGAPGLVIVYY